MSNQELWDSMGDTYDLDVCAELCERAGIADEWAKADGQSFEAVLHKACALLDVTYY